MGSVIWRKLYKSLISVMQTKLKWLILIWSWSDRAIAQSGNLYSRPVHTPDVAGGELRKKSILQYSERT